MIEKKGLKLNSIERLAFTSLHKANSKFTIGLARFMLEFNILWQNYFAVVLVFTLHYTAIVLPIFLNDSFVQSLNF